MKINRLSITNFLIIGKADINLNNRGLLLVQGVNDDDSSARSNGAGKSAIIDSVSWCLYGETARGESGDSVVNDVAKKNCNVTLTIEDEGSIYIISRSRKCAINKNDLLVYKQTDESTKVNLTEGTTKLTQELINKIIGCSYEVFVAAIYSSQETMLNLPEMTDKQLKLIVEESAGVDKLQAAYELAVFSLNDTSREVKKKKDDINSRSEHLKEINEEMEEIKKNERRYGEKIKRDIDEILKEIKEKNRIQLTLSDESNVNAYINELSSKLTLERAKISTILNKEKEKQANINTFISSLQKAFNKIEVNHDSLKYTCKKMKTELANISARVGKPCSECGKEYQEGDIKDASEALKNNLVEKLKELKTASLTMERAKKDLEDAILEKEKMENEAITIDDILVECDELQSLVKYGQKSLDDIRRNKKEIKELQIKKDRLDEELKDNPYLESLRYKEEKREVLESVINIAKQELISLEQEEADMTQVVDVFSRSGVRAHILDTVTPFLNKKTAEYLGVLSDGNISATWSTLSRTSKGELREKFSIDVEKQNGSKSFKGLSGGEKRKVRLSTAMALCDLVASRATKPIEFQFYDEVDHALDEAGLERLMTILEKRGKEKGTVLIISHNSLNDWGAESITVVNKGGVSEVFDVCC